MSNECHAKLKVGVIGVGVLGRHHTRIYKKNQSVDLVGVYDASPDAAEKVANEFGTVPFDSVQKLADSCDALSVAVPADRHFETAEPLLKKGKHLLIEKPITTSVKDAERLVKLADSKGLVLGVGHVERYNPVLAFIEKNPGQTRFMEIHRLAPYPPPRPGTYRRGTEVGVVLDLMIHDLDLVLRLVDSKVERIDAVGLPVLSPDEDIANARIKFKNGCVANLTASRISSEPARRFRLFQKDNYITMDFSKRTGLIFSHDGEKIKNEPVPVNEHDALEAEIGDFAACCIETIATGKIKQMKVTGRHGLDALKLAVKITAKMKQYSGKYPLFQ